VFFHAFVGLLVLVPCTVLVLYYARRRPGRTLAQAAAVLAAVLAPNLAWVAPLLRFGPHLGFDYPHGFFQTGPLWWIYQNFVLAFSGWHVFLLALGALGFGWWSRGASPALRLAWTSWVLLLLFMCVRGSAVPLLNRIEPANMVLPLEFALCPFAGHAAAEIARRIARGSRVGAALTPVTAVLVFAPFLLWLPRITSARAPLSARLSDETRALEAWIARHTDRSARIMIEDRLHVERPALDPEVPLHPYAEGHYLAALPQRIDRELIGGPYAEAPIAPHRADFASGRVFGRRLERWRPQELSRWLELYNVGWIVAWSGPAIRYLDAHPGVARRVDRLGLFHLYRTPHLPSFVERGSARVDARPNEIAVSRATPGGVVLRYHWYPGMCSDPPLPVGPAEIPGAAAPFIAVANGATREFRLRAARDWRGRCR
jgi:hypothetical protein